MKSSPDGYTLLARSEPSERPLVILVVMSFWSYPPDAEWLPTW
jgi:hypothetical protein